jgi:hypothetical protein
MPHLFDCALLVQSRVESAYFIVARRAKAPRLPPLQHGGARFSDTRSAFDCALLVQSRVESAYFIVARRAKAPRLPPLQGMRDSDTRSAFLDGKSCHPAGVLRWELDDLDQ